MAVEEWFPELMERIARNDEAAAEEFIGRYQAEVRIMVRNWLRPWKTRLRQVFDSEDICQSILAVFFLKDMANKYSLDSPEQLRRLFIVMVRNRVYDHARHMMPERTHVPITFDEFASMQAPEKELIDRELREFILDKLTSEEAAIAEHRFSGSTWQEIADKLGGNPDSRRIQFTRLANRLLTQRA
jgi:DNA-directed RNA polymerase specialized sigma24 family protein